MLRRIIPIAVIVSLLGADLPVARACAFARRPRSRCGRPYDQQIVESSVVETDPLLNQWVQNVSQSSGPRRRAKTCRTTSRF